MKKLANKSIFRIFGISALIVVGLAVGQFAYAGWNDASGDCPTVSVGNDTTREGTNADVNGCWSGTNISATEGDKVVVKVYFRNNSGSTANDVKIKVSDNRNATGTVNASGNVIVGGSTVVSGSGTIRIPSNTKLVYTTTYVQYKRTGYTYENQGAVTSVFSPGMQVGPIASTLSDQGIVKVVYTVTSTGGSNNGNAPVATTGNYSPYSETNGTATLHGSVAPNGDATCSYFEIERNGSSYDTTSENCSNQTTSSYSVPNVNLSGLSSGTYRYRLYAYNDNGEDYGSWISFTIDRGNNNSDKECNDGIDNDDDGDVDYPDDNGCSSYNDDSENTDNNNSATLNVTTGSYSWIDEDSGDIKLYGEYDDNDNGSTITYFEYRRDGGSTRSVLSGTYSNTSRTFSASLNNLADGDYQYRACADNGDVDCGNWKSFSVDKNSNVYDNNGDLPTIQTLSPFQITDDFVTFDGYYDMNGCSGKTYFEYGTNNSFGSRTSMVSRSSGASGSMTQSVSGLSSNTTYYYRAVGENCEGTARGITKSFRTTTRTIINDNPTIIKGTTTIRNIVTTTNIGGGARYIRLTIDNGRDTIVRGDELLYDVAWENVSNTDLKDLVLEVTFPESLQITSTDRGQIDRNANAVYVNIKELRKLEKDDMTIRARITGTLKDNDPITARAIMAFENPENKAQENAIAYDSDSYLASTNVLGASIFGLDFLPGTLAGWLFIILLLVLLILIIRYATRREEHHHYYRDEVVPPTRPVVTNTTTTTSAPEVDYTPYRPTPKDY